jgi:hypothetical protein
MMLRSYEDLKLLWERYVSLLTTGLDVRKASEGLQAAITRFDEWLEGARQVETLIESVATRTGRSLGCAAKFRKVMEQVIAVRQSASASLEEFDDLPNLVDSAAISETRTLFEQGKYKDLGEILARRAAGKS